MNQEQQKEFFSKSFTLQGRMFFPHLLQPKQTPEDAAAGKKPKFKLMFAWPKTANQQVMNELGAFINQAKESLHTNIPWEHFVNPIKDYDMYRKQNGQPNPDFTKGCYWVNASTIFQPTLVGADRQPVMNDAEVYSGRNCVINISFYNIDGTNGGKRGLGTNVNAVMLLEGGAHEGGGAEPVDPNVVFGSFQVDTGLMNQGGQAPSQPQATNTPAPNNAPFGGSPAGGNPAPTHGNGQVGQSQVPQQGQYGQQPAPQQPAPQAPQQGQVNTPNYGQGQGGNNGNPFGI